MQNRLGQHGGGQRLVAQLHEHRVAAGCRFRRDPLITLSRNNEQRALGTCVLDGGAHQGIEQLFQNDLARDSLGHLDHGREVEVLDARSDGTCQARSLLLHPKLRIELIKLTHLAIGSPAKVTAPGVL